MVLGSERTIYFALILLVFRLIFRNIWENNLKISVNYNNTSKNYKAILYLAEVSVLVVGEMAACLGLEEPQMYSGAKINWRPRSFGGNVFEPENE